MQVDGTIRKYRELLRWMKATGRIAQDPLIVVRGDEYWIMVPDERMVRYVVDLYLAYDEAMAALEKIGAK